jgi:hypothetical protein
MIIVKATPDSEAGVMPEESLMTEMAVYHEELARAGALLDASGLRPSSAGWRIRYESSSRHIIEGPFAVGDALTAGYTLIQARSREEALEWARRFPNPRGNGLPAEIEVRPLFELEDFQPSNTVDRFRELSFGR